VLSALAAVLDRQVRTAAMVRFNGISVRIATAPSTTKPANLRSLEDCAQKVVVLDLRVPPVQHEYSPIASRNRRHVQNGPPAH
jgi:hypothetical protein